MSERPNVLFLMADEHRADVAGFAGDSVVRTPTLDWLASTGYSFENAYTPAPICIPARQSMMVGKLPRTCGCEVFGDDLQPGSLTFARQFARHGYMTACAGKLHHTGWDQMQGWRTRIGDCTFVDETVVEQADGAAFERYREARHVEKDWKWTDSKEIQRAGVGGATDGWRSETDGYTVDGATNFIEEYFADPYYDRPEPERPLLLKVSLVQPHYPYLTSHEKFTYYLNRVEPYIDREPADHPFLRQHGVEPGVDVTVRELRRATAAYYGMVETVDEYFRHVLNALEHVGEDLDEWLIVYTSDHGEMLGEHGIWEKQKFYEGSARVPLLVRWPEQWPGGETVDRNVNLCDLFATLCEAVDIPTPDNIDSRSLLPLIEDPGGEWLNETISQFDGRNVMIKWDTLKYQYYGDDGSEVLFDLERDPGEETNYVDEPRYADVLVEFRERRADLGFGPNRDSTYRNAGY